MMSWKFYVKSILANLESQNVSFFNFLKIDLGSVNYIVLTRVSQTDTDSEWTDTDTIFSNYPGYTDILLDRYLAIT